MEAHGKYSAKKSIEKFTQDDALTARMLEQRQSDLKMLEKSTTL